MKKSIFLIAALMLVCAGCSKTAETSQSTAAAQTDQAEEATAEETTAEETTAEETTAEETTAEEATAEETTAEDQTKAAEEETNSNCLSIVLENKDNYKYIWLPTSAEADAIRDRLRKNRESYALEEDYFPTMMENLLARDSEQTVPEVEVNNKLDTVMYGENKVLTLEKEDGSDYDAIVFYIHGGMYAYGIDPTHITFCDKLVDELNVKAYMPLYPLAPEATYEDAYDCLDALYPDLVAQNKPIYIMGDSAGGGLSVAYTEYLKEKGEQLPDKIVALSPWMDVTLSNSMIEDYAKDDLELATYAPTQVGKIWAGDTDTRDYRVSPMFGNMEGLPDTMIITGTGEIMCPDSIQFYKKLKNLGQKVTLVLGEDFWHVFPLSDMPQSDETRRLIKEFINE